MEKLRNYNIFVILSLDGYGETANRNRILCNGKNYWSVLEYNLNHLLIKDIGAVRMTVVPESVSELYSNYSSLLNRGFKHINFAIDYTSKWTRGNLEIYRIQFAKVVQLYLEQIIQKKRVYIDFIDHIALNAIRRVKIGCQYGFGSIAVSANGYVFPCHREALDSFFEKNITLEELLDKKEWPEKICVEKRDKICKECDLFDRCYICMVNLKKMYGSLENIPQLLCEVNKIHIFEIDRMLNILYEYYRDIFLEKFL